MDQSLAYYDLPSFINPVITDKQVEFSLPVNLSNEIKEALVKTQPSAGGCIVRSKPKANRVYLLSGGGSTEKRIEILLFILSRVIIDGKPIFGPKSIFPFPKLVLEFLSTKIAAESNAEDVSKIEELNLPFFEKLPRLTPDPNDFTEGPMTLTLEEATSLVTIFGNDDLLALLEDCKEDKLKEKRLFDLSIPSKLPVMIRCARNSSSKFEVFFADCTGITAAQIRAQIETGLKVIQERSCIVLKYSEADPVDPKEFRNQIFSNGVNHKDGVVVIIPIDSPNPPSDEGIDDVPCEEEDEEMKEDFATTLIYIFLLQDDEETFNKVKENAENYFKKISLAECSKCQHFYPPYLKEEQTCYTHFPLGRQIFFNSGEMEDVVERNGKPTIIVRYTCCGEVAKDDIPITCEKHVPKGEPFSKFEIKIGHALGKFS